MIPYVIYSGLFLGKYSIYHVQDIYLDSYQIYWYFLPYDIIFWNTKDGKERLLLRADPDG